MPGYLVLESGEIFEGIWHGGEAPAFERAGEVVFNTSHSGYEEIATDPSYFKQIIVMTAPMMGNYGTDAKVWESKQIWIEGFICLQLQNSERDSSWKNLLNKHQVPILSEVDTRSLVLRLRHGGTPWGALVNAFDTTQAKNKAMELIKKSKDVDQDWVNLASCKEVEMQKGDNPQGPSLVLYDFGSKENIIRILKHFAKSVAVVPARFPAKRVLEQKPDAVFLSNGPGDPAAAEQSIQEIKQLVGKVPMMGVCMGHQILSLALGAQTYKLKFGHRGANHPIRDELLKQVYMSSQNHGYAVDAKTLPPGVKVTHTNLNDHTVAGFFDQKNKILGIQYHPESCPGPHEAQDLFKYFLNEVAVHA